MNNPDVIMVTAWATLGVAMMLPLVVMSWLEFYDKFKKRWGK